MSRPHNMPPSNKQTGVTSRQAPVQTVTTVVGAVFLLLGILGFIPGVTTDYHMMSFAGHQSGALLLGAFAVSVLHNIVHLLFGVAGLALARTRSGARAYLVGGGLIYLVLWLYGLIIDHGSAANFVPMNSADNWLHLGLAVGMVILGVALAQSRPDEERTTNSLSDILNVIYLLVTRNLWTDRLRRRSVRTSHTNIATRTPGAIFPPHHRCRHTSAEFVRLCTANVVRDQASGGREGDVEGDPPASRLFADGRAEHAGPVGHLAHAGGQPAFGEPRERVGVRTPRRPLFAMSNGWRISPRCG
jgi:hypothetical protein